MNKLIMNDLKGEIIKLVRNEGLLQCSVCTFRPSVSNIFFLLIRSFFIVSLDYLLLSIMTYNCRKSRKSQKSIDCSCVYDEIDFYRRGG